MARPEKIIVKVELSNEDRKLLRDIRDAIKTLKRGERNAVKRHLQEASDYGLS